VYYVLSWKKGDAQGFAMLFMGNISGTASEEKRKAPPALFGKRRFLVRECRMSGRNRADLLLEILEKLTKSHLQRAFKNNFRS
jgi:hypothetical protein